MVRKDKIKVAVVDDHLVFRQVIAEMFRDDHDILVKKSLAGGPQLLQAMENELYHVVILDLHMPGMDGIETAERVREMFPSTRVLMYTSSAAQEDVSSAVNAGAHGYILKSSKKEEVKAAILSLAMGSLYFASF